MVVERHYKSCLPSPGCVPQSLSFLTWKMWVWRGPFGILIWDGTETVWMGLVLSGPRSPLQAENSEGEAAVEALIPEQRCSGWAASQNRLGGFQIPDAQAASQTKMSESLRLGSGQQIV